MHFRKMYIFSSKTTRKRLGVQDRVSWTKKHCQFFKGSEERVRQREGGGDTDIERQKKKERWEKDRRKSHLTMIHTKCPKPNSKEQKWCAKTHNSTGQRGTWAAKDAERSRATVWQWWGGDVWEREKEYEERERRKRRRREEREDKKRAGAVQRLTRR